MKQQPLFTIGKFPDTKNRMIEELVKLDKQFFLFLNGLGNANWDGFWMFLTNKWSAIPLYFFLAFISYKQLGVKKFIVFLVMIALMILATDQLSNFFKYGVARLRPCHDPEVSSIMRLVKSYCGGKYGYFSAHAANSFAIVSFFTLVLKTRFKYLGIILFLWASLVAYSRIYIGVHYPLDIITGVSVGLLFGWLFSKLYFFFLIKIQS